MSSKRVTDAERERREQVFPDLAARYMEGEDINKLSEEYKLPLSTIWRYLKKMGISRAGEEKRQKEVQKEVRAKEMEALSTEAEKIATLAIGLGGIIARRYLPLLDTLMSEGKTLEYIAEDIMGWYEMKDSMKANEENLKAQIENLNRELSSAYTMSLPNFRYYLRTKILERYANQVIRARLMGVRLPVRQVIRAMQTDLLNLEGDLQEMFKGGSLNEFEP
jgi:hypothetical protein